MATIIQDVLKASIVLVGVRLLPTPEELRAFQSAVDADVVSTGISLNVGSPANPQETVHAVAISRDRTTLELASSRSSVVREYPREDDLSRLAEVVGHAISETEADATPRAFGYNVELVYEQDSGLSASLYLAGRLFSADIPSRDAWTLDGGAAKLTFSDSDTRWNVSVEPRFNDQETSKVFLSLNMHCQEERLPPTEEIADSLQRTWAEAMDFIDRLDASNTHGD